MDKKGFLLFQITLFVTHCTTHHNLVRVLLKSPRSKHTVFQVMLVVLAIMFLFALEK